MANWMKVLKFIKKLILSLLTTALLVSCGNSFETTQDPQQLGRSEPVDGNQNTIVFADIKSRILETHCLSCHSSYSEYDTFNAVKEAAMGTISSGRMPKNSSPLSNELKTLMRNWLATGAPETIADGPSGDTDTTGDNDNNPSPPLDILEPKWSSISQKIIGPKCMRCHGPDTFLPLATRQDFFNQRDELLNDFEDVEDSELIKRLQSPSNPMPPAWSGLDMLTTEEINIIIQWVEQGLPN